MHKGLHNKRIAYDDGSETSDAGEIVQETSSVKMRRHSSRITYRKYLEDYIMESDLDSDSEASA